MTTPATIKPPGPLGMGAVPDAPDKSSLRMLPPAAVAPPPDFSAALVAAAELAALALPTRALLLSDWWAEADLGFLYAARGVGKTWLSLLLARAIGGGEAAGPWRAPDPHSILYVDGEMPAELLQTRDRGLGMSEANVTFLNHEILFERTETVLNLTRPEAQEEITRLCLERGVKVLVLDNLSCLFSGVAENDADSWELVLPWLLALRRHRISVLVVAHAGRAGTMRGTSRREDAASWVIRLDDATDATVAKNGAKFVSSFAKPSRNTPSGPPPLEWTITTDAGNGRCTVTYRKAEGEEALLGWVRNGLTSATAIAQEMGVSAGTVSKMATRLIAAGRLEKKNREYGLPGGVVDREEDEEDER